MSAHALTVYVGLGTNIEDRAANLHAALTALDELFPLEQVSGVYQSDAVGVTDQPFFWNAAVRGYSTRSPHALLLDLKQLERQLGRVESVRYGPRLIDLDLLLHGDAVIETESLTVPHPALLERAFVLQPLVELDPDLRHPGTGELLRASLQQLGSAGAAHRIGGAHEVLGWTVA